MQVTASNAEEVMTVTCMHVISTFNGSCAAREGHPPRCAALGSRERLPEWDAWWTCQAVGFGAGVVH
jgi:hypothetical protein